jgi:hypothetical protein
MVTPGWLELNPACQAVIAACCALEPAPLRLPLSWGALLLLPLPVELLAALSLEAPQAARARVVASAADTAAARVVVLSFNSVPFDRRVARPSMPGRGS